MGACRPPSPIVLSVPISIPSEALVITAAPPVTLTQKNVESVTGIPARAYLELLLRPDAPPVVKLGKLRLVDRAAFVAWLPSVSGTSSIRTGAANDAVEVEPADGVAAVLESIGHHRAEQPKRAVAGRSR